jgi:GDPmannose 4,6-dehydratase
MKRALILGVDGQDGSYLSELLLDKGYEVTGWIRDDIMPPLDNIAHLLDRVRLVRGSLLDQATVTRCLERLAPDEIYNLAAPSMPFASWDDPVHVSDIAGLGVTRLLEAIRRFNPAIRLYQASSSEIFGNPRETPQSETTPLNPRNPYGVAKTYAHLMTLNYRERYGLFAVSGILFNHESPRRGFGFVTRKITHTAARIKQGLERELRLGDLDARRDWGCAVDYVRAMWLMLQQSQPDVYVIGTGITHSVREFCDYTFRCLDLDYRDFVIQDPALMRPPETTQLVANPAKAGRMLGWQPQVSFEDMICRMVTSDLTLLTSGTRPVVPANPIISII